VCINVKIRNAWKPLSNSTEYITHRDTVHAGIYDIGKQRVLNIDSWLSFYILNSIK